MAEKRKQDNQNADAEASISDEQLEETYGGVKYSDITLKKGYISSTDPLTSRQVQLQGPDELSDERLDKASGGMSWDNTKHKKWDASESEGDQDSTIKREE